MRIIYYFLANADMLEYYKRVFHAVICHIVCLCCCELCACTPTNIPRCMCNAELLWTW